jgi:r1t holin
MFTYQFWQLAIKRAVKTFVQSLLAIFSAIGVGLLTVSWSVSLLTAGMAAVLSVLTSMASAPVGEPNGPSLVPVGPRLHLQRPGHPSRRPSPPSQSGARLSSEGGHRGRTYRPESAFPRNGAGQQVANQVPRGFTQVGDLRGSGSGGDPERGCGRVHLIGGVHAATHVVSSRRVSGKAGKTHMSTGRTGLVTDGGLNDRRTTPLHPRFLRVAGHQPSPTPSGS